MRVQDLGFVVFKVYGLRVQDLGFVGFRVWDVSRAHIALSLCCRHGLLVKALAFFLDPRCRSLTGFVEVPEFYGAKYQHIGRERETETDMDIYIYIYICICISLHTGLTLKR